MLPSVTRSVTRVLGDALACYDHVNSSRVVQRSGPMGVAIMIVCAVVVGLCQRITAGNKPEEPDHPGVTRRRLARDESALASAGRRLGPLAIWPAVRTPVR